MEWHVERLIASCGLAQFSYRSWPSIEILPPSCLAGAVEPPAEGLPVLAVPAPRLETVPVAPAEVIVASRAKLPLVSLLKLVKDAPAAAAVGSDPALRRPNLPRGPLSLPPPEGFEAPIHVGYRSKPPLRDRREVAGPGPEAAAAFSPSEARLPRRFALLEEMAPDTPCPALDRDWQDQGFPDRPIPGQPFSNRRGAPPVP